MRDEDGGVLVHRLVHRRGDRAQEIRALLELRAVGDRVDLDLPPVHEANAHAIAIEPRREIGHERGRGPGIAIMGRGRGDDLEHQLQPVARLAHAHDLMLAEHQLEARGAPVQLPQAGLEVGIGAWRDIEHHDAVETPTASTG
jgi:hypothetical protein